MFSKLFYLVHFKTVITTYEKPIIPSLYKSNLEHKVIPSKYFAYIIKIQILDPTNIYNK